MATAKKPFDWNDPNNLRERAWRSVQEFFGKEEEEHPISPETVAKESQKAEESNTQPSGSEASTEEGRSERIYRQTEQRSLNDRPSTIWPG